MWWLVHWSLTSRFVSCAQETVEFSSNNLILFDLAPDQTICASYLTSETALGTLLTVEASVTALAGTVNMLVGFDEAALRRSLSSGQIESGGTYSFFEENIEKKAEKVFFCFSTYSRQGADFQVTAAVNAASTPTFARPPVPVEDGVPIIWRLDDRGKRSVSFLSEIPGDVEVSLVPISGEVDVRVFTCDHQLIFASETFGAEVFKLKGYQHYGGCWRFFFFTPYAGVATRSPGSTSEFQFSVTGKKTEQGTRKLIPGVFTAGVRPAKFSAVLNADTDGHFFAKKIDGRPELGYSVKLGDFVYKPGADGRVELSASEVTKASGRVGNFEAVIELGEDEAEKLEAEEVATTVPSDQLILLGFTSGSDEITLDDGVYSTNVVESGERRFRDFRFWVPNDAVFVDIAVDAAQDGSGVALFADITRKSRDPKSYRWNTMDGGNLLRFQTNPSSLNSRIFLPCRGCYLYLSVKSCVVASAVCVESERSKFWLFATSSPSKAITAELGKTTTFTLAAGMTKTIRIYPPNDAGESDDLVVHFQMSSALLIKFRGEPVNTCEGRRVCRVLVKAEDLSTIKPVDLDIEVQADSSSIVLSAHYVKSGFAWLRNHETFYVAQLVAGEQQKFKFSVRPAETETLVVQEPATCTLRVSFRGEDVKVSSTDSSRRVVHIPASTDSDIEVVLVTIACTSESSTDQFAVSFASTSRENALRVNFPPVRFALTDSQESKQWLVGYSDREEWMAELAVSSSVTFCVEERCIDCAFPSCTLQGFGRETVTVDRESASSAPVFGTLSVSGLSTLAPGKWVELSNRNSSVFRVVSPSLGFRIVLDGGGIRYAESPSGPWRKEIPKDAVYVQVVGSKRIRLERPVNIRTNEWVENPGWVRWKATTGEYQLAIEACDPGKPVFDEYGRAMPRLSKAQDAVDLQGLNSDGYFRVGVFKVDEAGTRTLEQRGRYLLFKPGTETTTYRTVLSREEDTPPSACAIERHPVIVGPWRSCTQSAPLCAVEIPIDMQDRCFALTVQGGKTHNFEVIHTCGLGDRWLARLNNLIVWIARVLIALGILVLVLLSSAGAVNWSTAFEKIPNWLRRKKLKSDPLLELNAMASQRSQSTSSGYRRLGRDI